MNSHCLGQTAATQKTSLQHFDFMSLSLQKGQGNILPQYVILTRKNKYRYLTGAKGSSLFLANAVHDSCVCYYFRIATVLIEKIWFYTEQKQLKQQLLPYKTPRGLISQPSGCYFNNSVPPSYFVLKVKLFSWVKGFEPFHKTKF